MDLRFENIKFRLKLEHFVRMFQIPFQDDSSNFEKNVPIIAVIEIFWSTK